MDNGIMIQFAEAFTFLVLGAIGCFLLWLLYRIHRTNTQTKLQRAEAFNKLLERFSTAKDFTDFLASEPGKRFLDNPLPSPKTAIAKIIRLVQVGVVATCIGIGLFLNYFRLKGDSDLHYIYQAKDSFFWALFATSIGIGLFITAVITYVLAKKWNLTNGNGQGNGHR